MLDLLAEINNVETNLLFLIVLGSSGAGKSHVFGTAPGKTLYLYLDSERHGVSAARKSGGDIVPICLDRDKDGKALKPDAAFKRGIDALSPAVLKKAAIETVVVDGLIELEKLVRNTVKWEGACSTKGGGHNKFAEPAETVKILDEYMRALRTAQDEAGVHVVVSGILDVQEAETNGAVSLAKPRATGYSVAESMIQQFPDILVIGKITKADGTAGRAFQTGTDLKRVSTDDKNKVKRFINFECRLAQPAGAPPLPTYIKADLKEVIKLKAGVPA